MYEKQSHETYSCMNYLKCVDLLRTDAVRKKLQCSVVEIGQVVELNSVPSCCEATVSNHLTTMLP